MRSSSSSSPQLHLPVLLLLLLLLSSALLPGAAGDAQQAQHQHSPWSPRGVHLGITSSSSSLYVTWTADPPAAPGLASWVEWGALPGKYDKTSHASVSTYCGDCEPQWNGSIFKASLEGLQPHVRYYYRVTVNSPSAQLLHSDEFSFVPVPAEASSAAFSGVITGDQGAYDSSHRLVKAMVSPGMDVQAWASFSLIPGDISYADGAQYIWDEYADMAQAVQALLPTAVSAGNHENYYDFAAYRSRFQFPKEEQVSHGGPPGHSNSTTLYYSFAVGSVRFVVMSSETDVSPGSPQSNWLLRELELANSPAKRAKTPWLILVNHRPVYCSNKFHWCSDSDGAVQLRKVLDPILYKYRVNVFLSGHVHSYERTLPVHADAVMGSYQEPQATVHVISGTAGAHLEQDWESSPQWSQYRSAEIGFTRMSVDGERALTFSQFACGVDCTQDLRLVDSFSLAPPAQEWRDRSFNGDSGSSGSTSWLRGPRK